MKKLTTVVLSMCLAVGAASVFAADTMSNDSMSKDSMSKDAMSKDSMKKDAMSKDAMKKDAMSKDSMSKDGMKKRRHVQRCDEEGRHVAVNIRSLQWEPPLEGAVSDGVGAPQPANN